MFCLTNNFPSANRVNNVLGTDSLTLFESCFHQFGMNCLYLNALAWHLAKENLQCDSNIYQLIRWVNFEPLEKRSNQFTKLFLISYLTVSSLYSWTKQTFNFAWKQSLFVTCVVLPALSVMSIIYLNYRIPMQ